MAPSTGGFGQLSTSAQRTNPFGPSANPSISGGINQQSSQPNTFGTPNQQNPRGGFGQPSQLGQHSSPFGQLSQPASGSPFAQVSQGTFPSGLGQSTQQASSTFGQRSPMAQENAVWSAPQSTPATFGRPTVQSISGFARSDQPQTNGTATTPSHLAQTDGYTHGSNVSDYVSRNATTGQITSFKSRPVRYIDGAPCYQRQDQEWVRIWFPDGPSASTDRGIEMDESVYASMGSALEEAYKIVQEQGVFPGGVMPEVPPKREWVRWDI